MATKARLENAEQTEKLAKRLCRKGHSCIILKDRLTLETTAHSSAVLASEAACKVRIEYLTTI